MALLSLLVCSAVLPGPLHIIALEGQLTCYVGVLLGLLPAVGKKHKLAAAAGSFLVLNAAAGLALWIWLRGRTEKTWQKVSYNVA